MVKIGGLEKGKSKSQAAMEFLMSYGWAILVVLVAIVALSYFGVLSPDRFVGRKCAIEPGIGCTDFTIQEDSVTLVLRNGRGEDISVSAISIGSCSGTGTGSLKNGQQAQFIVTGCSNVVSEKFKGDVSLTYIGESGLAHTTIGEVQGRVVAGVAAAEGGEEGGEEGGFEFPQGAQRYFFRSNPSSPQITEAIIDPVDVHVGDTQIMTVKVMDKTNTVTSVTAAIETDTGIKTEALSLIQQLSGGRTVWEGSWVVVDTHSATYRTTFTVTNDVGESTSATLTWTDPCAPATGGAWTLDDNCNIATNSVHGVSNGDFTVSGSFDMTIDAGATFVWNPGQSIIISSGSLIIADGAQLRQTFLWMGDDDGDGYPSNGTMYYGDTAPSGETGVYVKRSTLSTYTSFDYNESDAAVFPGTSCGSNMACSDANADGTCSAKAAGEQGLGACARCDGVAFFAINTGDNLQDTEGSNTCSATCKNCNGAGSCVNQGVEDLFGHCTQGSGTGDGCISNNCNGAGACGVQSSGDGGCPNCYRCTDSDNACEFHALHTVDGCTGAFTCSGFNTVRRNVCDGAGSCIDRNVGYANCAGTCASYCSSGSCISTNTGAGTCTVSTDARVSSGGDGNCAAGTCVSDCSANGATCSTGGNCCSGNCYRDVDGDRYAPSSGTKTCKASSQLGGTDCYDSNANAKPGQTTYFSTNRGDGSFDYNCDSSETKDPILDCLKTYTASYQCLATLPSGHAGYSLEVPNCGVGVGGSNFWIICRLADDGTCFGATALSFSCTDTCPPGEAGKDWQKGLSSNPGNMRCR